MPLVNVQVVKEQISAARKQRLIDGLMDIIVNEMGRERDFTVITMDEIPASGWFIGGKPVSETGSAHGGLVNVQIYVSKGTCPAGEMETVIRNGKTLISDVLDSCDQTSYFVIHELNSDGWGFDGSTMTAKRSTP